MKKVRVYKRGLLRRLEEERHKKRLAEKLRRIERTAGPRVLGGLGSYQSLPSIGNKANAYYDFPAPRVLDLVSEREATCGFFSEVRRLVIEGRNVRIVFMDTDNISAEALIYLLGQFHRLRLLHGKHRITGTYPKSEKMERLFEQSGFFDILDVKRRGVAKRASRHTRYLECKSEVEIVGATIPKIREELLGTDFKMPLSVGKKIYRALTEAMINVKHHAYHNKSIRKASLQGRWWLGAQLSVKKNLFTLTFYDAGVGIPKTLPRRYGWEQIRGILSLLTIIEPDDGQMIKAAVELGRTRTLEDNRGKGLMDLQKLIDQVGGGSLRIFSRCGSYTYQVGMAEQTTNDTNFVEGTLIKWELPLNMALDNLHELTDDSDDNDS